MLVVLALCAALGYGVSDFAGGLCARRVRPITTLLYGDLFASVLTLAALPFFPGAPTVHAACFAVGAGLAGLVGLGLMYRLMATEPLNVVAPITAVLAAGTPIACGLLGGEQPGLAACCGIVVGLVAVVLITRSNSAGHPPVRSRVIALALVSGAGFGVYFILLAHAGTGTGLWPLLISRATALAVVVPCARRAGIVGARRAGAGATAEMAASPEATESASGRRTGLVTASRRAAGRTRGRGTTRLLLLVGGADAAADVCFLLASRQGYLSLTSVITSLYPAVTVLLALTVLRERSGWLPRTGLALSAVSLVLIAQ